MAAKRIFLLIRHNVFREALALVLNETSDLEVVSQAGSLTEVRDANLSHNIDVALLDLPLSEWEERAVIRQLSTHHAEAVVLIVGTDLDTSGIVLRALRAGAAGVLSTSSSLEEIVEAIRSSAGRCRPIARGVCSLGE